MQKLDLLTLPSSGDGGAQVCAEGIRVVAPWGYLSLGRHDLPRGWYGLSIQAGSCVLSLQLLPVDGVQLIELTVDESSTVYAYLAGGVFDARLIVGGRPGLYRLEAAHLRRLGPLEVFSLLAGRFIKALRAGISLGRIGGLVQRALKGRGNFGVRAASDVGTALGGMHAVYDFLSPKGNDDYDFERRLTRIDRKATFFVCNSSGAPANPACMQGQAYPAYHFDSKGVYDYLFVVDERETLTRDALLLFAEAIARAPEGAIFLADKWDGRTQTAHVAWDPVFYADSCPTPYVVARAVLTQKGGVRLTQAHAHVISVPVAQVSKVPASPVDALPPPTIRLGAEAPCSIIIPTRDRSDLLGACLAGLFENTDWPHEVIVVDNGSREPATFKLFSAYAAKGLRVIRSDQPFNFSALCNLGACEATCGYLLFLNNDVVLPNPGWLRAMMAFAQRADIGAVGARLLYGDKRLQHGGIGVGLTEACGHVWRGIPYEEIFQHERLVRSSMRAAVTAACLCVQAAKFVAVGGFDEECFPAMFHDVDLCLKLTERGWFSLYCAEAEAFHLEGESRGEDVDEAKRQRRESELHAFAAKWGRYIEDDPWLPQSISRINELAVLR